jgi:hypothetical protein
VESLVLYGMHRLAKSRAENSIPTAWTIGGPPGSPTFEFGSCGGGGELVAQSASGFAGRLRMWGLSQATPVLSVDGDAWNGCPQSEP